MKRSNQPNRFALTIAAFGLGLSMIGCAPVKEPVAAVATPSSTSQVVATEAPTLNVVPVETAEAIVTPTKLSKSAALQLTLAAGLDPALTTTPLIGPNVTLEAGVIDQGNGDIVPNFYFTTFDGKRFTLSDHRGKVVLVNFWASWCGPCRSEMPDLVTTYSEYKDKGVVFAGVAINDDNEAAAAFAKNYNTTYIIGPDVNDTIARLFQVRALPTTIIVMPDGKLRLRFPGSTDRDTLHQVLDKILSESKSSDPGA
jgi:thiol-disulfide isomerase/thioredoxin